MRAYILDVQGRTREQMLKWLSENKRIDEIETFEDYDRFIERVRKSPPDCCFIRLGKDGIPGLKAAGAVQQAGPDARIIFVSEDTNYAVEAYEIGAYGYLIPPITKGKLDKYLINTEKVRCQAK